MMAKSQLWPMMLVLAKLTTFDKAAAEPVVMLAPLPVELASFAPVNAYTETLLVILALLVLVTEREGLDRSEEFGPGFEPSEESPGSLAGAPLSVPWPVPKSSTPFGV